jgi:drug/metabolite transporter (DMT)-like permease
MGEISGVVAALLSSGLGGTSVGATRYLVGAIDPLATGAFRFGIGFVLLLPLAAMQGEQWPSRRDWPGVLGLGLLFFGLFPILFNASLVFTTAARGALALSTLPLLTLVAGAVLGAETLTARKTMGVLIAMLGVAVALLSGLALAPPGAWRGDLLMAGAALCMALYSVWSKPFIRRSGPIPFTAMAVGVGPRAWSPSPGCVAASCPSPGSVRRNGWRLSISAFSEAPSLSSCGRSPWGKRRRHGSRFPSPSIRSRRRWSAPPCWENRCDGIS